MDTLKAFLDALPSLSVDHLNALIALGALALAGFVIYVALCVVKQ